MTLEELQAEFPHGSRWQAAPHVRVVVGWQPADGPTEGKVLFTTEGYGSDSITVEHTYFVGRDYYRIPDPVPCPITEAVKLSEGVVYTRLDADIRRAACTVRIIPELRGVVLHPPRDGEGFMRATWEGGPG